MTSHQQKNTQKIFWPLPCFLPSSYTKKSNKRNHTQSHVLRFHRLLSRCVNINTQAVTFCACLLVKHLVKNRPKRGFLSILGDKSVQKSLDYCVNCLLLKIFFSPSLTQHMFSYTHELTFPFSFFPSLPARPQTNTVNYGEISVSDPILPWRTLINVHWCVLCMFSVSFSESVFFLIFMCLCMCLAPGHIIWLNGGVWSVWWCVTRIIFVSFWPQSQSSQPGKL